MQDVVDRIRKPTVVPKEILDIPNFRAVCDKCEHRHRGPNDIRIYNIKSH